MQLEKRTKSPRVVAIGFNKCATRSLTELFRRAGHSVVHHKVRKPWARSQSIGRIMKENLAAGRKVFHGADEYTFYSDLIYSTPMATFEGASKFREILRDYPDTFLILNLRDREQWINSRLTHGHGEFAKRELQARTLENLEELTEQWRSEWDDHITAVREFMVGHSAQYIEFNLDIDRAEKLTAALPSYNLDPQDFFDVGRTRGKELGWAKKALKKFAANNRPRSMR